MGGNRKKGFLRGNSSGRNGSSLSSDWFCSGCDKIHKKTVFRTGHEGKCYCDRTYYKMIKDPVTGALLNQLQEV